MPQMTPTRRFAKKPGLSWCDVQYILKKMSKQDKWKTSLKNAQQIASMIVWRSCPWSPARMTQDLRDGSDPSVDPSTAHWSLVRNGLGVSVAVRKPFLKTGNGLRDTKGTNPNVNFWIRSSSVRSGEKHSTVPHFLNVFFSENGK